MVATLMSVGELGVGRILQLSKLNKPRVRGINIGLVAQERISRPTRDSRFKYRTSLNEIQDSNEAGCWRRT